MNVTIKDLMDVLDAPDLEIREDSEASCAHIKEVVMKNITTRKTVRRTLGWVSALAAVLVLSVLVLAGTGERAGVALLDGMTAEEEAQFRSDHELGFADSSVSADGTVRYYDIHGNVIFEGTEKEAAVYEAKRAALHLARLEESTDLIDFSAMTMTPTSVSEIAVREDGSIPDLLISNGHMAIFTQEDGAGWKLEEGSTAGLHFVSESPCYAVFYLVGEDGQVLEEADGLGRMAEPQWETVIPADGIYYFAVIYASAAADTFTDGMLSFQ